MNIKCKSCGSCGMPMEKKKILHWETLIISTAVTAPIKRVIFCRMKKF